MNAPVGRVWLVGAGPGDPGLLTLAGARALAEADVVLYDALSPADVLRHCRADAELVAVGKRAGAHSMAQEEISSLLVAKAREGRKVVRLKGGDPFVFGRGSEEALACKAAGVPFTVVPGVTSAVAVPAYAGIPVTHRGLARSFAVVTGSEPAEDGGHDWGALARVDTLVVLMGAAALQEVARELLLAGREASTPAASISNGTMPGQRTVRADLGTIAAAAAGLPTPLITVIGEVAALADQLSWRERAPLAGKSVVVTRTRTRASALRGLLEGLGARVIEAPVLEIRQGGGELVADERLATRWDWIVFSSQNGVEAFFERLDGAGKDARVLGTTRIAAVGAATATSLKAYGIRVDFVPGVATGGALAEELPRVHGARVLLPGGSLSEDRLADALRRRGAHVEQIRLYETVPACLDEAAREELVTADCITFASASSARFLREALGEVALPDSVKLCAIGPQAAEATLQAFGRIDGQADNPSVEGLAAAVVEALA